MVEGICNAPLLWNFVLDELGDRLESLLSSFASHGFDLAPLIGNQPLPGVAYADDVRLMCRTLLGAQTLLHVGEVFFAEKGMQMGRAKNKTALLLPMDSQAGLHGIPAMAFLDAVPLAVTAEYVHLGYTTSHAGSRASVLAQCAKVISKYRSSIGLMKHGGVRQLHVAAGIITFLTRVRPMLLYALHTWGMFATKGLSDLILEDDHAQRMILAVNVPVTVARAIKLAVRTRFECGPRSALSFVFSLALKMTCIVCIWLHSVRDGCMELFTTNARLLAACCCLYRTA